MIGSTVNARSRPLARKLVRVAISAKASPSAVVPTPTSTARNSVFQATPQRRLEWRQSRPQIDFSKVLPTNSLSGEIAGIVLEGADQDLEDREEDEERDQADDQADR